MSARHRVVEIPRCPLGYCANGSCQTCFPPFEDLSIAIKEEDEVEEEVDEKDEVEQEESGSSTYSMSMGIVVVAFGVAVGASFGW